MEHYQLGEHRSVTLPVIHHYKVNNSLSRQNSEYVEPKVILAQNDVAFSLTPAEFKDYQTLKARNVEMSEALMHQYTFLERHQRMEAVARAFDEEFRLAAEEEQKARKFKTLRWILKGCKRHPHRVREAGGY